MPTLRCRCSLMHTRYSNERAARRRLISATYLATCAMPYLRRRARPVRRTRTRIRTHVCMRIRSCDIITCMSMCLITRASTRDALSAWICFAGALVFAAFSIVWISNDPAPLVQRYAFTYVYVYRDVFMMRINSYVCASCTYIRIAPRCCPYS